MANLSHTLTDFNPQVFNVLGQLRRQDTQQGGMFPAARPLARASRPHIRKHFKASLLMLTSVAALSLSFAPAATAQNNDVDAFTGSVNGACTGQTPIAATPTNGRNGNDVSGSAHCIGDDSSANTVSGNGNTLGNYNYNNAVSGFGNCPEPSQNGQALHEWPRNEHRVENGSPWPKL